MIEIRDLGTMDYDAALQMQTRFVADRKAGLIGDQLLFVEHPHVVTLGRNAHIDNVLAPPEVLESSGIALYETDRGGDVTYHGPGQVVGYPILDLTGYKRDVRWYVQSIERAIIGTLAEYGIHAERVDGLTGVWTDAGGMQAKIAAIGVHISRWVTSHGFALNVETDLKYFQYIVPCGLTKPVTSLRALGVNASRQEVVAKLSRHFLKIFDREGLNYGRSDAADGREHRRGNVDEVAEEARR
jgi:lipoyl(octanoyl) transferase